MIAHFIGGGWVKNCVHTKAMPPSVQASNPASNPWAFVGESKTQELSTPPPVADLDQSKASTAPVTPGLVTD